MLHDKMTKEELLTLALFDNDRNDVDIEELNVTENGTYSSSSVAYSPVNVNLPLGSKSVTANGTYNASDDNLQGYSSVTVDIDDTDLYRDTTDSTYESVKTLSNCGAFPMLSLTAEINAVQDLHGYDHPWAGGAGKNKIQVTATTQTINGVTFTVNNDGTIKVNGTATADVKFVVEKYILKAGSSVILNGSPVDGSTSTIALGYQGYGIISTANSDKVCDRTSQSTDWNYDVYIGVASGYTANNLTFKPMIRLASEQDATFEPYSNICPITGWDSIDVCQSGTDTSNPTTHTTALSTTCYGGSKDIKGNERFTHGHIASYNGETLPSTWISDRDEYAEGTTPTIGAEVVYELATPTTATSDAIDLTLAEGVNNIWADSGDVGDARYFRKVEL